MPQDLLSRIDDWRRRITQGEYFSQEKLDNIAAELASHKKELRPKEKMEDLPLFNVAGEPLKTSAPRWICHLLGLRHRGEHILLLWRSPCLGDVLILQIRAWDRDNSPGHLDISVGGHLTTKYNCTPKETALAEMWEETGLTEDDLDGDLHPVGGGYANEESRPENNFYNWEWRDVWIGRVKDDSFGKINFEDGEVAAMVLITPAEAEALSKQDRLPRASGLMHSLPRCLKWLKRQEKTVP